MISSWNETKCRFLLENEGFGTVCPPFVVLFCFTQRKGTTNGGQWLENDSLGRTMCCSMNGTTNGGQFIEHEGFGGLRPPFVVLFRFAERNGTTHGGQLVEHDGVGTICLPCVGPFRFTERNGTTNGMQLVEIFDLGTVCPPFVVPFRFNYITKWNNNW